MKKIIIIGICLVTAAIVYGFVDYLKTDKKQLQRMYGDEPAADVTPARDIVHPAAAAITPVEKAPAVTVITTATNSTEKPVHNKSHHKELNLALYSRAALEKKFIMPDTIAMTVKSFKKAEAPTVQGPERNFVNKTKKAKADEELNKTFKRVDLSLFSRAPLRRRVVVVVAAVTTVSQKN